MESSLNGKIFCLEKTDTDVLEPEDKTRLAPHRRKTCDIPSLQVLYQLSRSENPRASSASYVNIRSVSYSLFIEFGMASLWSCTPQFNTAFLIAGHLTSLIVHLIFDSSQVSILGDCVQIMGKWTDFLTVWDSLSFRIYPCLYSDGGLSEQRMRLFWISLLLLVSELLVCSARSCTFIRSTGEES